jgi:hypothetical protein
MSAVTEILNGIEEAAVEMRRHSIFARAEKAHQKNIADLDSAAYILRERFHQQDMRDASGIFQEAVSEVCCNAADLYALMLADPAEFGRELAARVREYSDDMANKLAER